MELIPKSQITELIPLFIQTRNVSEKQSNLLQECMGKIRIYGNISKQYYHLRDSAAIFKIDNYERIEFDMPEEKFMGKIIDGNGEIKKKWLLTRGGLYRLMYSSNNNIGRLLRRCIEFIFDELFKKKYVTVGNIGDFIEEKQMSLYVKTVKDLQRNLDLLEKAKASIGRRCIYLEDSLEETHTRLGVFEGKVATLEIDKIKSIEDRKRQDNYIDTIQKEKDADMDYIINKRKLEVIAKHTKTIYIYLESMCNILLSRKSMVHLIKEDSDEREKKITIMLSKHGIDEYDINEYDINSPPYDDMVMIFSIFNKKQQQVRSTSKTVKQKTLVLVLDDLSVDGIYVKLKEALNSRYPLCSVSQNKQNKQKKIKKDLLVCTLGDITYDYQILSISK